MKHIDRKREMRLKVIGLTGGVGSGKSMVSKLLKEKFSCYLLIADDIGRECMKSGQEAYKKIVTMFGNEILLDNKEINRKKLGEIVFWEPILLEKLNAIIHPCVRNYIETEMKKMVDSQQYHFIVIESAILIEAGYQDLCDEIWYVYVKEEIRKIRLKKSRGYTEKKIDQIIKNQLSEKEFRMYATRVIDNNGSRKNLEEELEKLLVQTHLV